MNNYEKLKFAAQELRNMAPAARSPEGGTSHDGRRAFQFAADELDHLAWRMKFKVGGIR